MNLNTSINRSKINLLKKKSSNLIGMNYVCSIFFFLWSLVGINSFLSKRWDQQNEFISLSESFTYWICMCEWHESFCGCKFKKVTAYVFTSNQLSSHKQMCQQTNRQQMVVKSRNKQITKSGMNEWLEKTRKHPRNSEKCT